MFKQIKKIFVILLAIGFVLTMTAGAVSAYNGDHHENHDDHRGYHDDHRGYHDKHHHHHHHEWNPWEHRWHDWDD